MLSKLLLKNLLTFLWGGGGGGSLVHNKLSFAAFKILLSLTSGNLIAMCLGMGLFGLSCWALTLHFLILLSKVWLLSTSPSLCNRGSTTCPYNFSQLKGQDWSSVLLSFFITKCQFITWNPYKSIWGFCFLAFLGIMILPRLRFSTRGYVSAPSRFRDGSSWIQKK